MKGYPAVLTALLLGFLPGLQLHALETDTFQVTDLTGHLPPERQQVLTRQAQDQLDRILRFYGEPPGTGQMGKIHLEFDQPRSGIYATVFLMQRQGNRKVRVVRVFGAEKPPQQLAHKLTHASFISPTQHDPPCSIHPKPMFGVFSVTFTASSAVARPWRPSRC